MTEYVENCMKTVAKKMSELAARGLDSGAVLKYEDMIRLYEELIKTGKFTSGSISITDPECNNYFDYYELALIIISDEWEIGISPLWHEEYSLPRVFVDEVVPAGYYKYEEQHLFLRPSTPEEILEANMCENPTFHVISEEQDALVAMEAFKSDIDLMVEKYSITLPDNMIREYLHSF